MNKKGWNYRYVGEYLRWVKESFSRTRIGGTVRLSWAGEDLDEVSFRREFLKALNTRINLKGLLPVAVRVPRFMSIYHVKPNGQIFSYGSGQEAGKRIGWRKLDQDYQISLWRDSRRVRDISQRIIVRQFETKEARERLGHLLTKEAA